MVNFKQLKHNWELRDLTNEEVAQLIEEAERADQYRKDWLEAIHEADRYKKIAILSLGGILDD